MRATWVLGVILLFLHLFLEISAVGMEQAPMSATVVFWEDGFPTVDTVAPTRAALTAALPQATFAGAPELPQLLTGRETRLLVLPFGSAFPEAAWTAIYEFL